MPALPDAGPRAAPRPAADARRDEALAAAERLRGARRAALDGLRSGDVDLAGVLDAAARDPLLGTVKIVKLVEVVPGVGKVAARRALAAVGVPAGRAAADVAGEERAALLAALATGVHRVRAAGVDRG